MGGNSGRGLVIQPRDRLLFEELAVMQVVDREQAKIVARFGSTTRANARLLKLTRAGFLRRFFLGTAATGRKALYALSAKSAALIGVPLRGPRRRKDTPIAADFFVEHQLAINWLYCALKHSAIPVEGVEFHRWLSFHEPLTSAIRLIPDGYFELCTPHGFFAAFLEVDLGHERGPVWKQKVRQYLQFALSGEYAQLFGQPRFRVLVLAPSERRLRSIRRIAGQTTDKLFRFASLEAVQRDGLFAPIWLRAKGEISESLIPPIP